MAAEEQLANSATKRGTIMAMDPNNGEILVMASAPSFDPNAFVTRIATPEGRKEIAAYYTNEERPLLNRAIQGRYLPARRGKFPNRSPRLAARRNHGRRTRIVACGGGITIGNKFTRCMGSHGSPPVELRDYQIVRRLLLSSGAEDEDRRLDRNDRRIRIRQAYGN